MRKPKVNFGKLTQVIDGKSYRWYKRSDGTFVEASVCCDCLLAHVIEMKPTKRYMRVKVWREDEKTNELRRKRK